ncbi:MAG TPA: extracellular solute-binding protein [Candidatus Dormibacteraeota bacterium]|jgi:multiple sugar transport system substrate-binding protein|nr:extracellular solute-binding protein [Candidatus Dormibacteraeota bacterium]
MNGVLRKHITAIGLVAVALWTAGCGGSTNNSATSTDKGPIQIWTMEDSTSFTNLVQGFTQQTGIPVQVEAVPWANVNDKLTTAVASGNGPDLMQVGLSLLPSFEAAGALLDLSPYVKDHPGLQSSSYLGAVASDKINPSGKVLSVPWVSDVRVLFYRSDILSAAGISSPPTTWTQFHADAAMLAQRGKGKYGYYIPQWDSALPVEFTWEAGGNVLQNGKVTFDTPQFKAAADFYISFYKDKLVPTASDFDQTQGFISGSAPMVISGPYLAAGIKSTAPQLDGKWNVAVLPKDQAGTSLFAGSNMGVWAKSKHVGASLRLLDYLAQTNAQLNWFKATNELPTAKSALSDSTLTSDPMVKIYTNQLQDAQLLPLVPKWDKISQAMLDSLNSIVLKGSDETSTLAALNATVSSLQS